MSIRIVDFRPLKIVLLSLFAAALLHCATPVNQSHIYSNSMLGVLLGMVGFAVMMWGGWLFKKFDTAIYPTAKTDCLVTTGIYKYTRTRCICVWLVGMLLAIAVYVGTFSFYLSTIVYFVVINISICRFEENIVTTGWKLLPESVATFKWRTRGQYPH